MNIAVLFGEVGFVSHKIMIDGVTSLSNKKGINVFLFTSEAQPPGRSASFGTGEFNIYNLPDFDFFDGIIVDFDSVHNKRAAAVIMDKIMKSKVPVVSINIDIDRPNTATIVLENQTGISKMVEHLVKEHNAKSFHFISGPIVKNDAIQRRDAFVAAMDKYGIEFDENDISYGNFQYHSGESIMKDYLKKKRPLPDVFVAANDYMAIGAMKILQKAGYEIPKDVIVTGYDDCLMASYVQPRLTTVVRDEFKAGKEAVRAIEGLIKKELDDKQIVVKGKMIYSHSCGCHNEERASKNHIIMELSAEKIFTENNLEFLKAINIDFSNINSFPELTLVLQRHIESLNFDYFYMCLCGNKETYIDEVETIAAGKDLDRDVTQYAKTVSIPLAYENGVWNEYKDFDIDTILPEDCLAKRDGAFYIVTPIHYGEYCIGYCVVGNPDKKFKQRFLPHLLLGINNSLGNIREQEIMQTIFSRINEKWEFDELTGIYNRAGLWNRADKYIKKATIEKKKILVFFVDLDGLKAINDQYGHAEGDSYIKSMADILVKCNDKEDVVARYGGDEYIVLTSYREDHEIEDDINRIQDAMIQFNNSGVGHKLSASIGYQKGEDFEKIDIKQMIAMADKEMYINKKQKKNLNPKQ